MTTSCTTPSSCFTIQIDDIDAYVAEFNSFQLDAVIRSLVAVIPVGYLVDDDIALHLLELFLIRYEKHFGAPHAYDEELPSIRQLVDTR